MIQDAFDALDHLNLKFVKVFENCKNSSDVYGMVALIFIFTCKRYMQPLLDRSHKIHRPPK